MLISCFCTWSFSWLSKCLNPVMCHQRIVHVMKFSWGWKSLLFFFFYTLADSICLKTREVLYCKRVDLLITFPGHFISCQWCEGYPLSPSLCQGLIFSKDISSDGVSVFHFLKFCMKLLSLPIQHTGHFPTTRKPNCFFCCYWLNAERQ